jgi:hypothetical protein
MFCEPFTRADMVGVARLQLVSVLTRLMFENADVDFPVAVAFARMYSWKMRFADDTPTVQIPEVAL